MRTLWKSEKSVLKLENIDELWRLATLLKKKGSNCCRQKLFPPAIQVWWSNFDQILLKLWSGFREFWGSLPPHQVPFLYKFWKTPFMGQIFWLLFHQTGSCLLHYRATMILRHKYSGSVLREHSMATPTTKNTTTVNNNNATNKKVLCWGGLILFAFGCHGKMVSFPLFLGKPSYCVQRMKTCDF